MKESTMKGPKVAVIGAGPAGLALDVAAASSAGARMASLTIRTTSDEFTE
jgi:threonine dehydrogenase-like Zn-dependent dehydrogenase